MGFGPRDARTMAALLGRQPSNVKVDDKGRMVVPNRLRAAAYDEEGVAHFNVGFVVDNCLWMHTRAQHEEFIEAFEEVLDDTAENRLMKSIMYGNFADVKTDNAGRISIPSHLLEKAGLGREAVVIGMKNRVELWDANVFAEVEAKNMATFKQSVEKALALVGVERRKRSRRDDDPSEVDDATDSR